MARRLSWFQFLLLSGVVCFLYACSSSKGGYGYGDGPPPKDVDVTHLADAVPKVEPITRAGNPNPYTILGKTYHLLPVGSPYKERGEASWYGSKFHGRKTANGETYSMYAMTAAHKTLRIPAYVRVTNLENGRTVIVRVNDRGPFHGNRIIDLSYAAAKKLGYSDKGTARVEVEAIDPRTFDRYQKNLVEQPHLATTVPVVSDIPSAAPVAVTPQPQPSVQLDGDRFRLPANTYLQAGSFSSENSAAALVNRLQAVTKTPAVVRQNPRADSAFKVLLGPLRDNMELLALRKLLLDAENIKAFVVYD